jgi:hypothetical protein
VSEVCGPAVLAGENQVWNGTLTIPGRTPVTNFRRRESLELSYYLKVTFYQE